MTSSGGSVRLLLECGTEYTVYGLSEGLIQRMAHSSRVADDHRSQTDLLELVNLFAQ